jgi:hypothetical protein
MVRQFYECLASYAGRPLAPSTTSGGLLTGWLNSSNVFNKCSPLLNMSNTFIDAASRRFS